MPLRRALVGVSGLQRAALALTLLCVLALAVRGAVLATRPEGSDFKVYYDASRALLAGHSPLDVDLAIYLPCFAVATAPFALLPFRLAIAAWFAASTLALAWSAFAVASLFARPGQRAWPWLLWVPMALAMRPIDSNFANGQVNTLILAVVLLGLRGWASGRTLAGGAWIGLATACKIVPGIFILHALLRREWRAALQASAIALCAIALAPLPFRGVAASRSDLQRWAREVPGPFVQGVEGFRDSWPRAPGQSAVGAIYRALTEDPKALLAGEPLRPPTARALARARDAVRFAWAILFGILALGCGLRAAPRGSADWARGCALAASTALLAAPIVHKAHMVWLLLPLAAVVSALFERDTPRWARGVLAAALALCAVAIGGSAPALIGRGPATYLLLYSAVFCGALALHVGLSLDVCRRALTRR